VTVNQVTYCRIPILDPEHQCPIEEVEAGGEATAVGGVEAQLQVEIEAEVYFQPENVPAGPAPAAPVRPETTTGETTGAPTTTGETTGAQ
jgi:hypothetical protein